jgi:FkbM family methyltransferase
VYAFEINPDNLEIFQQNMVLNPGLSERIDLIPKALWDVSGETKRYTPHGPGTSITGGAATDDRPDSREVTTVSIDDFVSEQEVPRVDYIKMDIEGAELSALRGAEKTIRTFTPKLAISIYHREDDSITIPSFLQALNLGYKLFMDHFTIYGEETVLFAEPIAK